MSIEASNLPSHLQASVDEDLAVVRQMYERELPLRSIRIVSLQSSDANGLPSHNVQKPAREMPVGFASRCRWERLCQSFQLIEDGEAIWVVGGGDSGALYGFGEVLRCLSGVIWGGLSDDDTLFGPTRPLPTEVQTPLITFRARDGGPPSGDIKDFIRFLGRNRYNLWRRSSAFWATRTPEYQQVVIDGCAARGIHLTLGDHSIHYFLKDEEFEEHPEWFGLRNGKRCRTAPVVMPDCPHLNAELPIQPCYSNEVLAETLTDRMAAHMWEWPQATFFGLWPHDGVNNWCHCEECRSRTPYEMMYDLAMRLEKKLPPQVTIELIAYSNLLNVPQRPLPHSERTFTMLCPYLRHYRHRIYDDGGPELETGTRYPEPDRINPVDEREYGELYNHWEKVWQQNGSVAAIFEYGGGFYDETRRTDRTRYGYHPGLEIRADEFAWYAQRGVEVVYLCTIYRAWPDSYHECGTAEMMWGAMTPAEFRSHYYQALAGVHGAPLAEGLQGVAQRLLEQENPREELARLRLVLEYWMASDGSSRQIQTYLQWCGYVEKGWLVRECELGKRYEDGLEVEKEIHQFFDDCHGALAPYVDVKNVQRYSSINMTRMQEWIDGKLGTNYTL